MDISVYFDLMREMENYLKEPTVKWKYEDARSRTWYYIMPEDGGWCCTAKALGGYLKYAHCLASEESAYTLTRTLYELGANNNSLITLIKNFYAERTTVGDGYSTYKWVGEVRLGILLRMGFCDNKQTVYCEVLENDTHYVSTASNINTLKDLECFLLQTFPVLG